MDNEKIFFEQDGLQITNTRFVVGGKTYAISSIASFRQESTEINQVPRPVWLLLCVLFVPLVFAAPILVMFLSGNVGEAIFNFLICGGCVYLFSKKFKDYKRKFKYKIILSVSSGEIAAFETLDENLSSRINSSLTEAVIYRG